MSMYHQNITVDDSLCLKIENSQKMKCNFLSNTYYNDENGIIQEGIWPSTPSMALTL